MKFLNALIVCVSVVLANNSCASGFGLLNKKSHAPKYSAQNLKVYLRPDLKYASFSHVCKMSDGKRYYAVLGTNNGTVFVNYTDNKLGAEDMQFFPGAPSHWRECRSYRHPNGNTYAYVVTEGPEFKEYPGGLQIFKLGVNSVELVNTYLENFNSAHTIFIDTDRGWAFINGSGWRGEIPGHLNGHQSHLGGMRILDLAIDPENPRELGFYSASYTHDSYALGEVNFPERSKFDTASNKYEKVPGGRAYIVYLADIIEGYIRVLNVSDPANPKLEHSVHTPLHNQFISVHNVWASEDKRWLFATEETTGSSLLSYDVSDPLKPRFVSAYRSQSVADGSVIHNVVIKGNIAYCSWYQEGLRLLDISNPVHPREIAFFDSSTKNFPKERGPFHGNWSVDVDDRGLIMISDIEEGLFILKRTK